MTNRWKAFPGPQTEFLSLGNSVYEALFGGSKGPGKTDCLLMEAMRQVKHPRYHALLIRRTFKQLQEIMDRAHRWYPSCGGKWNAGSARWEWPSGAKISMGHCQHEADKYNYQGHEYHYLGFDQLEQFTESQYLYLLSQQRTSVPQLAVYVRATANPGGVGHGWVKRRFIDAMPPRTVAKERVTLPDGREVALTKIFIPATLRDNPALTEHDPMYVARLHLLDPVLQRAFIYGDWDVFEGQFFTMWRQELHVIQPCELPQTWLRFASLDYGYAAPSSVGWWAIDYDNRLIRYRELYQERLTYTELAHAILAQTPCQTEPLAYLVADPAIWSDIAHHAGELRGENGYEIMQKVFTAHSAKHGCEPIRIIKGDNDRVNGWIRLRERLTPNAEGRVGLQVFATCRAFTRTVPELIHDDGRPEDLNTEGEDHVADETRYAVMSRPAASPRPPPPQTASTRLWERVGRDQVRHQLPQEDEALLTEA